MFISSGCADDNYLKDGYNAFSISDAEVMSELERALKEKNISYYLYRDKEDYKMYLAYPEVNTIEFNEVKAIVLGLRTSGYQGRCFESANERDGLAKKIMVNNINYKTSNKNDLHCVYWPDKYDQKIQLLDEKYKAIKELGIPE